MIRTWLADDDYPADRIRIELAWQPRVTLEEGLRREVEWYQRSARTPTVAGRA
jgi:dTDP-D-glucose 4,6-dehydratase